MKFYKVRVQRKLWNEFISNKDKYEIILAEAINDTKLLTEEFIDTEDGKRLIKALNKLPMVEAVRSTIVFLGRFIMAAERNPEVLEERDRIRESIVIPLMKQFIFIFAVIDKDVREIVEERVKKADEEGIQLENIVSPLLKEIMEKLSAMEISN